MHVPGDPLAGVRQERRLREAESHNPGVKVAVGVLPRWTGSVRPIRDNRPTETRLPSHRVPEPVLSPVVVARHPFSMNAIEDAIERDAAVGAVAGDLPWVRCGKVDRIGALGNLIAATVLLVHPRNGVAALCEREHAVAHRRRAEVALERFSSQRACAVGNHLIQLGDVRAAGSSHRIRGRRVRETVRRVVVDVIHRAAVSRVPTYVNTKRNTGALKTRVHKGVTGVGTASAFPVPSIRNSTRIPAANSGIVPSI